jgi:hypothetical protein
LAEAVIRATDSIESLAEFFLEEDDLAREIPIGARGEAVETVESSTR